MGLLDKVAHRGTADPAGTNPSPLLRKGSLPTKVPETVWEEICHYYHGNPFCGIILETPEARAPEENFYARLAHICAFFGAAISLSPKRNLIIFPRSMDSELLVHRLSRGLKTTPLIVFEADNPLEAVARIAGFI